MLVGGGERGEYKWIGENLFIEMWVRKEIFIRNKEGINREF